MFIFKIKSLKIKKNHRYNKVTVYINWALEIIQQPIKDKVIYKTLLKTD